ncbi:hypothetical protein [Bradyrhizobium embrapense]|uniref:hypothetical protein n=1 Tax=Bradyrhizobium embrapense TaxID=630921 RepID=UPI00067D08ED|nr:hypothetical protein [Bradyrhizobium embrapense]
MKNAAARSPRLIDAVEDKIVCWSRMQSEGGQRLEEIVLRKEYERQANGGIFCWGVGNAPNRCTPSLARSRTDVDVVFSVMKSRPKLADVSPSFTLIWRRFIDCDGIEQQLPAGSLVTSKGEARSGTKSSHFALFCKSSHRLELSDYGSFDPSAFRNVGPSGGAIGSSQVTALVRCTGRMQSDAQYRINLRAKLHGSYWVKLVDPIPMDLTKQRSLALFGSSEHIVSVAQWLDLVSLLREDSTPGLGVSEKQLFLL